MLIAQQIFGLFLAAFSLAFMLWFLANLIRESRTSHPRHAPRLSEKAETWPVRSLSPQVPALPVRAPHNPDRGGLRPVPSLSQGSRVLHTMSR